MIDEIPELLEMWESGLFSKGDLLARLVGLVERHAIDDIVAELPPPWRDELVAYLRTNYDNDIPIEDFVWLSSSGAEPPGRRELIRTVRAWLQANPVRPSDV